MKTDTTAPEAARSAPDPGAPSGVRVAPGALAQPRARRAAGVGVEHGVVAEDDGEAGAGTHWRVGSVLHAGARVGANCRVGPYAIVGGAPMDTRFRGEPSTAVLEDG